MVTVWDARKFMHPLLTFTEKDAAADGGYNRLVGGAYTNLEFSSSRRGMLASMERDAHHVRLWNTTDVKIITQESVAGDSAAISRESSMSRTHQPQTKRSWANLPWSAPQTSASSRPSDSTMDSIPEPQAQSMAILHNTHRSTYA